MTTFQKFMTAAFLVFSPLALLAWIVPVNKYTSNPLVDGSLDCDGPLRVLIFAAPVLLIYLVGTLLFAAAFRRDRKTSLAVMTVFCLLFTATSAVRVREAFFFKSRNEKIEQCGTGW